MGRGVVKLSHGGLNMLYKRVFSYFHLVVTLLAISELNQCLTCFTLFFSKHCYCVPHRKGPWIQPVFLSRLFIQRLGKILYFQESQNLSGLKVKLPIFNLY